MSDKIEKRIDIPAWWNEWKADSYKDNLKGKEFGKIETESDRKQAAELLEKIQSEEIQKNTIQEKNTPLSHDVKTSISKLNRPEAEKWITQAYTNIESTIKNSKNEKWIAGFLGRIMNRILN